MRSPEGPPGLRWQIISWVLAAVLGGATPAALGQGMPPAAESPEEEPAPVESALGDQELQALVAPIALYPDLVLVLTMQASLAPLDIVQADRFLNDYAVDSSLEPDPDWDESVIGLLNYPSVVTRMSGDLDWTQSLGDAVIDQLQSVQDAIQEFRAFMHAIGALESNEQATVLIEDEVIRIEPTDEDAVFIPQYDPDALLAALYSTAAEPAEDEAAEGGADEVASNSDETEEAAVVEAAAATAEAAPVVAPASYQAVAPPPITYSDPSPSWLGTAATFAGGAAVGGLIGWAIADDDDDDHDDGDRINRGNVNIEDSTIVVNRGDDGGGNDLDDLQRRASNERLKRDAREKAQREQTKRDLEQRYADRPSTTQTRSSGERKVAGLSTSGTGSERRGGGEKRAARVDRTESTTRPGREATPRKSAQTSRAGDSKQPAVASAFGGTRQSASATKRDSDRGLKSRSRAKTEVKPSRSQDGSGVFARKSGGSKAGASRTQRGQKSRRGKN